jgi:hypothetical protein
MIRPSLFTRLSYGLSSCAYSDKKPLFTPFWASLLVGSIVTSSILTAVAGNHLQIRRQLDRMELEIRGLKEMKGVSPK